MGEYRTTSRTCLVIWRVLFEAIFGMIADFSINSCVCDGGGELVLGLVFTAEIPLANPLDGPGVLIANSLYRKYRLLWGRLRVNILPSRTSVAYQMTNGVLFMSLRFTQSCPTCGRRIEVRASLMGCDVRCQHCDAVFVAHQDVAQEDETHRPVHSPLADEFTSDPLMDRVEQALNRAEESAAVS